MRAWVIVATAVVGGDAVWVWLAPYHSTLLWWALRGGLFWIVPLLVLALVAGGLLVAADDVPGLGTLGWAVALLGGAGYLFFVFAGHAYLQDKVYAAAVRVTADPVPALGQRAPYPVALAQARPNLGDTPGDIAVTAFIPQVERFGTLVETRGWLAGYQTVLEQDIPLSGRGSGRRCEFDPDADARLGGWFAHNLGRQIAGEARWLWFSGDDAYGYCDGDVPKVVVPLKEQDGWLVVTERPAGVAVYDGRTNRVSVRADGIGLPGPSYPISLARDQRESTHALGGIWDYVFGRVGWETTDDSGDVNASNPSEFVLPAVGPDPAPGTGLYVSQLTGRGSATSISGISALEATMAGNRLAPLTVHRLDPAWVSTSAIGQRIQADYQDIPNWQNLKILEIAPTDGSSWVATIGNEQNVLYRVAGVGSLGGDRPTCLNRGDGSRIRCGTLADQPARGSASSTARAGNPASRAHRPTWVRCPTSNWLS